MKFFVKRLLISLFTIMVTIIITFFFLRAMPGDIVNMRAMELVIQQGLSYKEAYELAKSQLNFEPDSPIYIQLIKYISNLFKGNLGYSLTYRVPVNIIIKKALPWTVFICSFALIISFILGCLLGLLAVWLRKIKWLDTVGTIVATTVQTVPSFLIGVILLVIFGINFRLFPLRGAYSIDVTPGFNIRFIIDVLYHAVLPALSYIICATGSYYLVMKSSASSIISENFIAVARAKGLTQQRILIRYLGKNAIIPLIPGFIVALGGMLGGSMFIETIFGYPGLGFFFAKAIATRDYVLIQGLLILTTVAIIMLNLLADFIYALIDPRIKLK